MTRTCRFCDDEFTAVFNKPGRIDVCTKVTCQERDEKEMPEVDLLGGNMIWHHKTAPVIEIKYLNEARIFANQTKRIGAGVVRSICQSKEFAHAQLSGEKFGADRAGKMNTGAGDGDLYYSKVGEKRTVKR